jgi:amino acid transporter
VRPTAPPRPLWHAVAKRVLLGRARPTYGLEHTLLPKFLALPIFSSDALSSVAYATEQIMVVLLVASAGTLHLVMPIALAIAALMTVVVASYWQICHGYPQGGGGYVVTKDNFGKGPSLVAASALLIDFVLTVAVSVVAGVVAITSAVPSLLSHKVLLSVLFIVVLTLANLRGVREAGALFAVPTYGFIVMVLLTVAIGLAKCVSSGCPTAEPVPPLAELSPVVAPLGLFVILHAFSSGATALTGVEAIATAVPAFRRPQSRNAQLTLATMGVIAVTMFLGISYLASRSGATVSAHRSVLAQVSHAVFSGGLGFFLLTAFTTAILVLAANTSYQAFPRLLAILAEDRFVPRQFRNLGDRLVFSNGVVVLAVTAAVLIWIFDAQLDRLIQLYVVGVFTDFTLSQAAMVKRWRRMSDVEPRWRVRAFFNGVGAVATGLVLVITAATKFTHGAWIVFVAAPILIVSFYAVNAHYAAVSRQLRQRQVEPRTPRNHVVLLVPDINAATAEALGYVRSIRPTDLRAVHLTDEGFSLELAGRWLEFTRGTPELEPLPKTGGNLLERVRAYVEGVRRESGDFVTVVVPEVFEKASILRVARRLDIIRLKAGLLRERRIAVTDAPVVLSEGQPRGVDGRPLVPQRTVALVFVSGVHDATVRAVNYARSLHAQETRAVFFALSPGESERIAEEWMARGMGIPLEITDAPFRDLSGPMLDEVRRYTARPETIVAAVIPELIPKKYRHYLLHRQTALFVKRLFLFEERVILTSVPYQLD